MNPQQNSTHQSQVQQNTSAKQLNQQQQQNAPRSSGDIKWNISLKQDDNDYIIIFSHSSFPSLADYSKLHLANKKIQHLIIPEMWFYFLENQIKVTFSKKSLGDINPYKVLQNIYDKMLNHYTHQQQSRFDYTKSLEIYPQVIQYLATPISFEIFFRFSSYKYPTDNKYKDEWLRIFFQRFIFDNLLSKCNYYIKQKQFIKLLNRISNILSYDIYEEVLYDYEGSSQGYDIQQTIPESQIV